MEEARIVTLHIYENIFMLIKYSWFENKYDWPDIEKELDISALIW